MFFCIFHIFSLFNLGFFHICHIFSLFNLPFFHNFHIFSQFSSVFSPSFHYSTWVCSIFFISVHYIQSRSLSSCNSIKTFDFSTLDTTIPHSKLKDKLRELVQLYFIKKNGQRRYKYIVLGRDRSYFVNHHSDSTKQFSETDIFNMLEFLIDNIFVMFGRRVFQQTVG
jgi:hypothetical protein